MQAIHTERVPCWIRNYNRGGRVCEEGLRFVCSERPSRWRGWGWCVGFVVSRAALWEIYALQQVERFSSLLPRNFCRWWEKNSDPWYQFSSAVDEFNEICKSKLCGSLWISIDETMCAWKPRKTALGGLPNISFIVRKPEPLGKTILFNSILVKLLKFRTKLIITE